MGTVNRKGKTNLLLQIRQMLRIIDVYIACSFCFGEGRGSETLNKSIILQKPPPNVAIICNIWRAKKCAPH